MACSVSLSSRLYELCVPMACVSLTRTWAAARRRGQDGEPEQGDEEGSAHGGESSERSRIACGGPVKTSEPVRGDRAGGWAGQSRSEVVARHGMVATSQPLAAQAGLDILRRGGNAADAAVAAAAMLTLTEPGSTHLGGDAFALVYDAAEGGVARAQRERLGARRLDAGAVRARRCPPRARTR